MMYTISCSQSKICGFLLSINLCYFVIRQLRKIDFCICFHSVAEDSSPSPTRKTSGHRVYTGEKWWHFRALTKVIFNLSSVSLSVKSGLWTTWLLRALSVLPFRYFFFGRYWERIKDLTLPLTLPEVRENSLFVLAHSDKPAKATPHGGNTGLPLIPQNLSSYIQHTAFTTSFVSLRSLQK